MIPKSILRFLCKHWGYDESEIKEEMMETEHYIVWYCGIDHLVDRDKTPDGVIFHTEFCNYNFNKSYKKSDNVVIKFSNKVRFFYYILRDFIEHYYGDNPFEMRVIQIPEGLYYLEFKLDDKYSYVFQQLWDLTEEEKEDVEKFTMSTIEDTTDINMDKVFTKMNIADDMKL
jgi:hypothetical protein